MKDRSHEEAMVELFRDDPQFAADYLNDLLLDGEPADLLVALRQIAQAQGGVRALAKETELNANHPGFIQGRVGLRSKVSFRG